MLLVSPSSLEPRYTRSMIHQTPGWGICMLIYGADIFFPPSAAVCLAGYILLSRLLLLPLVIRSVASHECKTPSSRH